jgi:hypothetical protein
MGTSSRGGAGMGAPPYVTPTAPPWSVLALLPRAFWPWMKNYYAYATSFLTLGSSGTATNNIQIQSDAFFVLLMATMVESSSDNLTLLTYRPITAQIFDTSAGMNMFSQAIMADEFFGDAMQPGLIAFPYIFKPGGTLQLTLVNLEAVARNVRVTFHGFKANPNLIQDEEYANVGRR